MKEKNLRKILEKFSKSELIEIAVEVNKCQASALRSSVEIAMTKRIDAIDKKIDENIAQFALLRGKFDAIPECKRNISNGDVRDLAIEINDNAAEYTRLNEQRDKLVKELYG